MPDTSLQKKEMPDSDYQGSSVPLAFIGRSILSIRRNQVVSMEGNQEQEIEELELFQKQVTDRFNDLNSFTSESILLSISWLRKLLDSFLCCEEEFKVMLLLSRRSHLCKPPLDRLVTELLDRVVKALDVCNAISDGADQVRQWQKQAEIAVAALNQKLLGEGQFRRARKALTELTMSMLDEREGLAHRNRSFGRKASSATSVAAGLRERKNHNGAHLRSHSWSVSRNWSAAKQLQAMGVNFVAPKGTDLAATGGLAVPVYTMSSVLFFVMWTMVAAFPCQDRAVQMHFPTPPRQFTWAAPMIGLHERILDEWKKEKKNSGGLLEELQKLEKSGKGLLELGDSISARSDQVGELAVELGVACKGLEEGLVPFQRQVREIFHRLVRSRSEILDCLDQAADLSRPMM